MSDWSLVHALVTGATALGAFFGLRLVVGQKLGLLISTLIFACLFVGTATYTAITGSSLDELAVRHIGRPAALFLGYEVQLPSNFEATAFEEFDEAILGTWVGEVSQPDAAQFSVYNLVLSISKNDRVPISRSDYAYRSDGHLLECGGVGELISASQSKYVFFERITVGRDQCRSGNFVITLNDDNSLTWLWDAETPFGGTLKRR